MCRQIYTSTNYNSKKQETRTKNPLYILIPIITNPFRKYKQLYKKPKFMTGNIELILQDLLYRLYGQNLTKTNNLSYYKNILIYQLNCYKRSKGWVKKEWDRNNSRKMCVYNFKPKNKACVSSSGWCTCL